MTRPYQVLAYMDNKIPANWLGQRHVIHF